MGKRLIVCCDGTWSTPDHTDGGARRPTNVVLTARALRPTAPDGTPQVVFYDPGVGTGSVLDRISGAAFGRGLSRNVQDAYRFLVHNFADGDEIFLFGFSRGAFTARSTAGLIRNCGLLRKRHADRIGAAYALYRRRNCDPDSGEARSFRAAYARETRIRFIGVWDTVGALGIPFSLLRCLTRHRYQFHDVRLSRSVDGAFHAVAIDERRGPFRPALWKTAPQPGQQVQQAWFAGSHANVGGGYRDTGLSDVAFMWMKEKAEAFGLAFDEEVVAETVRPDALGALRESRRWLFRLLPAFVRAIGQQPGGCESVHATALRRYHAGLTSPYRPDNLVAYLQRAP